MYKTRAKKLFNRMMQVEDPLGNYPMCFDTAKSCAIIAMEEIIDATKGMVDEDSGYSSDEYWEQVLIEIKNL